MQGTANDIFTGLPQQADIAQPVAADRQRQCRLIEVPAPQAANPVQELQIEKRP
jgi:hypothetical protein